MKDVGSTRKLMEQAVAVMRESIAEPRSDGKASPKVGAVLLKPDDTVDTAHRGELRQGDHAEFTLLERKNRASQLDGSILFATLEPCAPNARKAPKLSCAERIVNARIAEVWVGIEDPDPTVDRKGIKYLQDNGVTVHMFDRDLQDEIRADNREFIAQALERAAAAEQSKPVEVKLSDLEQTDSGSRLNDLSSEALESYRVVAKIPDSIDTPAFRNRLERMGLLTLSSGTDRPTRFGTLLFGKEPRLTLPQAGLLATLRYPDETDEIHKFDGPLVLIPDEALQWLHDKLPNPINRSQARRRETNELLFEVVREGIVNALIHRDYSIDGAKCQLTVTPDTITIMSPGRPIEPITLEQIRTFNAPMLSRNPVLHFVFNQMGIAEERGLGLTSIRRLAVQSRLPIPRFDWVEPYLRLTIYRSAEAVTSALPPSIREILTEAETSGWQWISKQGSVKAAQYAVEMGIDNRTARRHLSRFEELGLVRKTGSARNTQYDVIVV